MHGKQWLMAGALVMAGTMVYADDGAATAAEPVAALSFSGYLDMSWNTIDPEDGESTDKLGIDRFELQVKHGIADNLIAEAHAYGTANEDESEDIDLESAWLTYVCPKSGANLIAGKWISKLGYEAYHAPGLLQYSTSETLVYPGAVNGVGLSKMFGKMVSLYGAALSGVWDSTDTDADEMGYETQLKLMPVDGLTLQAGYATEEYAAYTEMLADEFGRLVREGDHIAAHDQSLVNLWAEYVIGADSPHPLRLAAEWNDVSDWGMEDTDGEGYLVVANYTMCSKASLTLRHSALDVEDAAGAQVADSSEFTISPTFTVRSNWFILAEYKTVEDDVNGDWDSYALESLYTF